MYVLYMVLLARVQCVFLGGSSEPFFITLTLIDLVTLGMNHDIIIYGEL